jgi:hypothetical protein
VTNEEKFYILCVIQIFADQKYFGGFMARRITDIKTEMRQLEQKFDRKELSEETFQMRFGGLERELGEARAEAQGLPSFCKTLFIMDLVFCCIRALIVPFSILGYSILQQQGSPLLRTVFFEILTGALMAILGILCNILLLMRKPRGAPLGFLNVIVTVGSIGVGIWQASLSAPPNPQQASAYMAGAGFSVVVRLILLGLYINALTKFSQWHRASQEDLAQAFD